EKAEILSKIGNKQHTIQRSKGLGENEPEMMWQTTMNPATRRLIRVSPTDAEKTAYIFETLLGDDLAERKKFIKENGRFYLKDADI
ncbi:MAG: DNA topoisomerase, partial [Clostridia bacterium]|nr:DNA topoisomerase [Clostridia bacterium]